MKAMILCAGLGTRLRPLTAHWPKPAMPFLGQPLIRYTLASLRQASVHSIGINTHHLPEEMTTIAQAECQRAGMDFHVNHEPQILGTGGGIRGLRPFLENDDFIVWNGDILFSVDLAPIVRFHRESNALATMVLLPMPEGEKYASVDIDTSGTVRRIAGQGQSMTPLSCWHFSGVHILSPRIFDYMQPDGEEDINRSVYPKAMASNERVMGYVVRDALARWSDVGTPARYLATHQSALFGDWNFDSLGNASPFFSLKKRGPGMLWVEPTVELNGLQVAGPALISRDVRLGERVKLGAAVSIGPNASIGQGANLNRVAVLDGATVPDNALLEDCIVGPGGWLLRA